MKHKKRVLVTVSPYLQEKLAQKAKEFGCSQAEVLRTSFIRLLEADR